MNYLEHKDKVKYIDGLLARDQEWQWFVECVEKNFEMSDVSSWDEYLNRNKVVIDVCSYFVKIIEICDKEWSVESEVLKEIIMISKFYLGILDTDYCIAVLKSNIGRLLFLIIWLTKLENQDNQSTYLADIRLLKQRNLWEIVCVDSMVFVCEKIEGYLSTINIAGIDIAKKCVLDNINKNLYPMQTGFIDGYRDKFLAVDAIGFKSESKSDNYTWQEEYIFQMLQVSIKDRELIPFMDWGGVKMPDSSLWTSDVIENMKEYFSDESTDFILETIDYIENKKEPSLNTKLQHCRLLKELVSTEENMYDIVSCSSYVVVSYMFEDRMFREMVKEVEYIGLIKKMQDIVNPHIIKRLKKDRYPISKEQKTILNDYYNTIAREIDKVEDIHTFIKYLENPDVTKRMDKDSFAKVCDKFYDFIEKNERDTFIATLFYNYMLFLMRTNSVAVEVDKRMVGAEIIRVQQVWQENYYSKQVNNLHGVEHKIKIETESVDAYNSAILLNPILVAKSCMVPEEDEMCKVMENASEHAFVHMVSTMHLSPVYPIKGDGINFEKHDIDIMLRQTVEKICQKKSYKFLNVLDIDVYVEAIHQRYEGGANATAALFNEEEKIYQLLQQESCYNLIPYDKNITVAHLTQLFPVLEIKIRQLASLLGVVPFKERVADFMTYKDSSSVLREMLQEVHKELGSFENVPDLLFVYHFMYNGNSLNVRNECLHGRDYINGSRVRFAFRLTLLAIYMLKYRIDVINENMSHAEDVENI